MLLVTLVAVPPGALPAHLDTIGRLLPARHVVEGIRSLMFYGSGTRQVTTAWTALTADLLTEADGVVVAAPVHQALRTGLRSLGAAAIVPGCFLTERAARSLDVPRYVGAREQLDRGTALLRRATARLPRPQAAGARRLP
ncbi:hypothetical protein [Streptomyces mangrovisoli]|uniref:Uncharacterized protein n=1 Tax=Streptomyces mangrovisoli TaxID=1428628 RepID=A0A1J4NNT6_9ACTN|nr:hypothetical protein [Streptomyces mangrovisoli]OIJ63968.1 hypothetical protein WN71_031745 [Streptomyces mangrovisoli]